MPLDAGGQGSFLWTPQTETNGNTALIRVTSNGASQAQGTSAAPFLIANAGHDYYLNDTSTAGDVFTTAAGDNATSGKSPDQPMASLAALLSAYPVGPGDTIHVDTGTYKVIFVAFPLEAYGTAADKATFMTKAFAYFGP